MLSVLIEKDRAIQLDFRAIKAGGTEHAIEAVNVLKANRNRTSTESPQTHQARLRPEGMQSVVPPRKDLHSALTIKQVGKSNDARVCNTFAPGRMKQASKTGHRFFSSQKMEDLACVL